jgi:ABC-type antimicrobial peptide transport system permease subunit
VWQGAVQTNHLNAYNGIGPIATGFCATFFLSLLILYFKVAGFLKKNVKESTSPRSSASRLFNKYVVAGMVVITFVLLIINFTSHSGAVFISFISGSILFLTLILIWRIIVSGELTSGVSRITRMRILSGSFYSFHPDKAIMPVLLIAAGLFAIVITGINRQKINAQSLSNEGGTGGYALWAETSVPLKEELNSKNGRKIHGIEDLSKEETSFIMGKRVTGDDASCLNLNFIATPPLLGIDPSDFRKNKAFSFASLSAKVSDTDPWNIINEKPVGKTIYGFADQTVLEWGLKKSAGDTLRFSSESGEQINIVIAGGLKPSIFQGYLLISEENMNLYWPSVGGYSVFLVRTAGIKRDTISSLLSDRFENYGITISKASDRLASFFTVTNTYLSVFTILGFFGMLLGVAGLGFVLHRNYTSRRKEFALMISTGYRTGDIKRVILGEQMLTLIAGIVTGILSGLVSASSSVNSIGEIPWISLLVIAVAIAAAGIISLLVSVGGIKEESLVTELRGE